jgi:hypothetical protein
LPLWARPAAREIDVDVLPVPPFCEAIAIIIRKVNLPKADMGYFGSVATKDRIKY